MSETKKLGSFKVLLYHPFIFYLFIYLKDFIYLFMTDREREAEIQAEGEAGSMQGAQCGTWSRVSRIRLWAEGGAKPLSHPGCPKPDFLNDSLTSQLRFFPVIFCGFFFSVSNGNSQTCINGGERDPWVAQRFSATFGPGHDPGDPGSSPTSGSLHGACFSLCLCLCLSLSMWVSHE